ncbi:uncharacterized protein LOC101851987 [Aplysia californica]|uniref:Uncharacterized protein LOC101851987 n=1 Tax=Aplysia californica TaxID=6500 RepID=A0ABM1AB00_APLCA|nr:uncharacterized protein LOC101851987 [Aplysia californica]
MTTIHRGGNLARQAVLTLLTFLVASGYLFTEIVAASAAVREPDTEIPHGDQWSSRHLLSAGEGQFPWLDEGADDTDSYVPLHRQRRSADNSTGSKSIWEEIEVRG